MKRIFATIPGPDFYRFQARADADVDELGKALNMGEALAALVIAYANGELPPMAPYRDRVDEGARKDKRLEEESRQNK